MVEHDTADEARVLGHGAIPLEVIQKYLNFQFSVSMDLFGSEQLDQRRGTTTPRVSRAAGRRRGARTTTCCSTPPAR
ncbi:MAG: hypothetical protein WKF47_14990 [Geodermatophilaceae bacterium]